MFRFTQEPSSGSQSQCLDKITGMLLQLLVDMNAVSVMAAYAAITLTAITGGQGKLTHFMYFTWLPIEAALSIFKVDFCYKQFF